jgi:hypothetical protein
MTRILKILVLIIIVLIFGAPSCSDEQENSRREESLVNASIDSIKEEFTAEHLSDEALYGFEKAAVLKLSDLQDYLRILTDSSLDISFRRQAGEMLDKMFVTENIRIRLTDSLPLSVSDFISLGLENNLSPSSFIFDSIQVHEPLHRISASTWKGKLTFLQPVALPDTNQPVMFSARTADISLCKESKAFGPDTLKIWTIRLGEIK